DSVPIPNIAVGGERIGRGAVIILGLDSLGLRNRGRVQHQRVQYAKDYRVYADAEGERSKRWNRKSRRPPEHTQRVPCVARKILDQIYFPHVSAFLLGVFGSTKLEPCQAPCFGFGFATGEVVLQELFEMEIDFAL